MEQFHCRTKIYSGAGAIGHLADYGASKVFLVTDPYFHKNGTAEKVAAASKAGQVEIFSDVRPDPGVELAAAGTARLKAFDPDLVIALGGGSAMDCAKAMVYFSGTRAKLVAIPTTSGSGSEVTDFAILTHNQVKHPLVDPRLTPDGAILDSDLLQELPSGLVADSGYDVIAHALESYVATGAGTITDSLARDAFKSAWTSLPASFAGCREVRLQMHLAATMAGMAFSQAGLGLCHAMAHSIGGMFHIPHGRLNAILLPAVVNCNIPAAGSKYAELARFAGIGAAADTIAIRNLRSSLIRLRRELKLPETLAQAGIRPREVQAAAGEIISAALADPCCKTNPVPVTPSMVRQVLEEVTGRG